MTKLFLSITAEKSSCKVYVQVNIDNEPFALCYLLPSTLYIRNGRRKRREPWRGNTNHEGAQQRILLLSSLRLTQQKKGRKSEREVYLGKMSHLTADCPDKPR